MNKHQLYTIGHSNHPIYQFIALLERHEIKALVDIRRFPSSQRLPHFNRLNFSETLEEHGIEYHWLDSVGTWVFDDEAVDLVQEPFVSGVPEMIDELVADIPDARQGFRLLFSAAPFPGYQRKLTRVREERSGRWSGVI